jgi:rod shape-determining protein MreD
MNFNILRIISFFVILLVQVLFAKNAVLFHTAFCFFYVLYILTFPVETNPLVLMIVAFVMGCSVDVFYNSIGMHAMATVLMAYIRGVWLSRITPQGGYDRNAAATLSANGFQWFIVYATPLVFVHHTALFFIEAGGAAYFWFTLLKVLLSTFFTVGVMIIAQLLFARK